MFFEWQKSNFGKIFANKQTWHDGFFIYNFFTSFTLLLFVWGEVVWVMFALNNASFLTLHYSIYFGVDWLGDVYNFLVFSGIATFIFLVNFLMAIAFYAKRRLLSRFLSASASLILLFLLIATSLIIYINWNNPGL